MEIYDTVSETIQALRDQGYQEDFNLKESCLECRDGQFRIFHDQFQVDQFFRFEGMTDPADETVVYAISSPAYGLKGVLVNGYGIYSEPITDEMLGKLRMNPANLKKGQV